MPYALAVRQLPALILLLCFAVLGSGTVEYLHNQQHAREDAELASAAKSAGLPALPHGTHDESNCEFHAQLHVPLMATAWIPLLVALGLIVAFLTQLTAEVPARLVPSRHVCRGPPRR